MDLLLNIHGGELQGSLFTKRISAHVGSKLCFSIPTTKVNLGYRQGQFILTARVSDMQLCDEG